jgi:phosphatidylserine synthase
VKGLPVQCSGAVLAVLCLAAAVYFAVHGAVIYAVVFAVLGTVAAASQVRHYRRRGKPVTYPKPLLIPVIALSVFLALFAVLNGAIDFALLSASVAVVGVRAWRRQGEQDPQDNPSTGE